MEVLILDRTFRAMTLLDNFESLIWTERYLGAGNFEFYTPMLKEVFDACQIGYYVWMKDSDRVMIIEDRQITTDVDQGNYMIVSGRSLEAMLDRRIVWEQTILQGKIETVIEKLLNDNVINPDIPARKIPNFIYKKTTDTRIQEMTVSKQFTGDNLYDAIIELCDMRDIGFKITLDDQNRFVFELFDGVDRSYNADENGPVGKTPYVVFSPKFDNVISSNYVESIAPFKNVTLVAGEDEGLTRRTHVVGDTSVTGLDRRELYTDARDIQSETEDGPVAEADYIALLTERGNEKLAENKKTTAFDGQLETTGNFVYGEDFFIGDIVQFVNEYGLEARVRVTEFIRSQDLTGYNTYPTFEVIEEDA